MAISGVVTRQNAALLTNQEFKPDPQFGLFPRKTGLMLSLLGLLVVLFSRLFR
jgi:hypothetical protein